MHLCRGFIPSHVLCKTFRALSDALFMLCKHLVRSLMLFSSCVNQLCTRACTFHAVQNISCTLACTFHAVQNMSCMHMRKTCHTTWMTSHVLRISCISQAVLNMWCMCIVLHRWSHPCCTFHSFLKLCLTCHANACVLYYIDDLTWAAHFMHLSCCSKHFMCV